MSKKKIEAKEDSCKDLLCADCGGRLGCVLSVNGKSKYVGDYYEKDGVKRCSACANRLLVAVPGLLCGHITMHDDCPGCMTQVAKLQGEETSCQKRVREMKVIRKPPAPHISGFDYKNGYYCAKCGTSHSHPRWARVDGCLPAEDQHTETPKPLFALDPLESLEVPKELTLTQVEMLTHRALVAELRVAVLEVTRQKAVQDELLAEIDPTGRLAAQEKLVHEFSESMEGVMKSLYQWNLDAQKRLGVKSIDDYVIGEDGKLSPKEQS